MIQRSHSAGCLVRVIVRNYYYQLGTGIVAGVWLDIAQFRTNITAAPATNGNTCELRVIEEYILGIGAGAGATLTIGDHVWGPELEIEIPIYHTTLTDICAISKTAAASESVTSTAAIKMRQDVETTTTVTEITQTAIQCLETGLLNCPASLRTTSTNKVTKTLTAVVTSDADPVFTAENTVVTAIAFGTNAHKMEATSGSPVSYVPKPTETSGSDNEDEDEGGARKILNATTGGVSNKLIIGVSVGVGVPVLIAIIAGLIFYRRRRSASIKRAQQTYHGVQTSEQYSSGQFVPGKKSPNVNVTEYQRR